MNFTRAMSRRAPSPSDRVLQLPARLLKTQVERLLAQLHQLIAQLVVGLPAEDRPPPLAYSSSPTRATNSGCGSAAWRRRGSERLSGHLARHPVDLEHDPARLRGRPNTPARPCLRPSAPPVWSIPEYRSSRIHTRPARRMCRVIARRAASICRAVIRSRLPPSGRRRRNQDVAPSPRRGCDPCAALRILRAFRTEHTKDSAALSAPSAAPSPACRPPRDRAREYRLCRSRPCATNSVCGRAHCVA